MTPNEYAIMLLSMFDGNKNYSITCVNQILFALPDYTFDDELEVDYFLEVKQELLNMQ